MQTRALPKITCHKLSKTKFSCVFSPLKLRSIYFLHWAHTFIECFLMATRKRERRTRELCRNRQIWDDREFEFFCALEDDHKWVRNCCLRPGKEISDVSHCKGLLLFIFNHVPLKVFLRRWVWNLSIKEMFSLTGMSQYQSIPKAISTDILSVTMVGRNMC